MNIPPVKWLTFGLLWLAAIAVSTIILLNYQTTPEPLLDAPSQWPADAQLPARASGKFTLVMIVHPQCPCTRASLDELARVLTRTNAQLQTFVFCFRPSKVPPHWNMKSDIVDQARTIKNALVVEDIDGKIAQVFKATTSGQTLLYDIAGRLRFNGGITPGRGHTGDSAGADSILDILNGRSDQSSKTNVYGCPIFNRNESRREKDCRQSSSNETE